MFFGCRQHAPRHVVRESNAGAMFRQQAEQARRWPDLGELASRESRPIPSLATKKHPAFAGCFLVVDNMPRGML